MRQNGDSTTLSSSIEITADPDPEPLSVLVVREGGDWAGFGACEEAIYDAAAALVRHRSSRAAAGGQATAVLASDAIVQRLNRTYRGKDAPTNVLSFPFQAPPGIRAGEGNYLGDVIVAAETVRREAEEGGIKLLSHLQHLIVHGLLHLLGHDHDSEVEAEAMERMEAEILASLGIADPYAADHPHER
jgi:probable rRNA maturation factor